MSLPVWRPNQPIWKESGHQIPMIYFMTATWTFALSVVETLKLVLQAARISQDRVVNNGERRLGNAAFIDGHSHWEA
jgi:hypothetical protein